LTDVTSPAKLTAVLTNSLWAVLCVLVVTTGAVPLTIGKVVEVVVIVVVLVVVVVVIVVIVVIGSFSEFNKLLLSAV